MDRIFVCLHVIPTQVNLSYISWVLACPIKNSQMCHSANRWAGHKLLWWYFREIPGQAYRMSLHPWWPLVNIYKNQSCFSLFSIEYEMLLNCLWDAQCYIIHVSHLGCSRISDKAGDGGIFAPVSHKYFTLRMSGVGESGCVFICFYVAAAMIICFYLNAAMTIDRNGVNKFLYWGGGH